jgi:hypothetical protein
MPCFKEKKKGKAYQNWRSPEVQKSRSSGVQKFRSSEVQSNA